MIRLHRIVNLFSCAHNHHTTTTRNRTWVNLYRFSFRSCRGLPTLRPAAAKTPATTAGP